MRLAQKTFKILNDECESINEKCDGYKEQLRMSVIIIMAIEIQHSVKGTNIQQQINSTCNETGDFLYQGRTS